MSCHTFDIYAMAITHLFVPKLNKLYPSFSAHRFRTFHDFGFVSLDILHFYAEDSGTYTCVARNSLGEAQTSTQIHCERKILNSPNLQSFQGFSRRKICDRSNIF